MNLSNFIHIDLNVARSVNLERDQGQTETIDSYQVTSKSLEVLSRFVSALNGEKITAWSLTGPYGMGKSAFANYLIALTGNKKNPETLLAWEKLKESNNELFADFVKGYSRFKNVKGFFRVSVTASYESLNHSIIRGLLSSFKNQEPYWQNNSDYKELYDRLKYLLNQDFPESRSIFDVFKRILKLSGVPIVIIIDEFGKNLEYMAHHPDKGDIFILQLLAEANCIYLFVSLHQAFEEYASGLTAQQRLEWGKIQGRFEDISFVESSEQMLAFMSRVLKRADHSLLENMVQKWADQRSKDMKNVKYSLLNKMDTATISSLYPLHPLTAAALPELCRRFAQNDRTLFAFLCSKDANAFSGFLMNREIREENSKLPVIGLDFLYDYFFSVSTTAFLDRAESQRWIEIQDIIRNSGSFSSMSQKVLKTVGVLNLISSSNGLKATQDILKLVLKTESGITDKSVESEIKSLEQRKILMFRKYANEYRLWEGSDFDIFNAIHEKKSTLAMKPLEQVLQEVFPLISFIASRHSYKTGTVRKFEARWISIDKLKQEIPMPQSGYDGLLVFCFGNERIEQGIPKMCRDGRPLIIAYAPCQNQIKELALEAAAAKAVLTEAPELVRDGVARKEAKYRVHAAEDQLKIYVEQVFTPGSSALNWYANGVLQKVNSHRDISMLASSLCDNYFYKSPHIGNEMINHDSLSSAAARARRELAEAMVIHSREKNIGMTGYGPEVAMYRSLFLSTDLHQEMPNGSWHFVSPRQDSDLFPLWQKLDEYVERDSVDGINIECLIDALKEPPFGLREGIIPLFICLFLMVHSDEIALFQEGVYRPYVDDAEISLLLKRPDLFSMKRFATVGLRREFFEAYLNVLNTAHVSDELGLRNATLLSIVGPLVQFVENLAKYSKYTRNISKYAIRIRSAILNATDPIKLLFEDLPLAVDADQNVKNSGKSDDKWKSDFQKCLRDGLLELMNAYDNLKENVERIILVSFSYKGSLADLYHVLRSRVKPLLKACKDENLKPVLSAIIKTYDDPQHWLQGIAASVVKKQMDSWNDGDIDYFAFAIKDYADRIDALEEFASAGIDIELNDNARVVSIMYPGGTIKRRVLNPADSNLEKAKKLLHNFGNLSNEDYEALYLTLSNEILPKDRK